MAELTNRIRASVRALFQPADVDVAEHTLLTECGDQLYLRPEQSETLERIRLAAVRFSGGRLADLTLAVQLAQMDWRDLLVAAGFADDAQAHTRWVPRLLDSETAARWQAGETLPEITWSPRQLVLARFAAGPKQRATVLRLTGIEPEPRYVVRLESGDDVEVFQRQLTRADP